MITIKNSGVFNINFDFQNVTMTNNGTINTNSGASYLNKMGGFTYGTSSIIAPCGTGYGFADVSTSGTASMKVTIQIQVDGITAAGTDYDQLKNSNGTFSLSNLNLNITYTIGTPITSYNPITIVSAGSGSINGTFASVSGLTNGWSLVYNSTNVQLVYNLYAAERAKKDGMFWFINYTTKGWSVMIRKGDWKYTYNTDDLSEFYDFKKDPLELYNLIDNPNMQPFKRI